MGSSQKFPSKLENELANFSRVNSQTKLKMSTITQCICQYYCVHEVNSSELTRDAMLMIFSNRGFHKH